MKHELEEIYTDLNLAVAYLPYEKDRKHVEFFLKQAHERLKKYVSENLPLEPNF